MAITLKSINDTAAQLDSTFRRAASKEGEPTELTKKEVERTFMSGTERVYLRHQFDGFSSNVELSLSESTFKLSNAAALKSLLDANADGNDIITRDEMAHATKNGQRLWRVAGDRRASTNRAVEAGIDLVSGDLKAGARSVPLNATTGKVDDQSMSQNLRVNLNWEIRNIREHMQRQGSDSHSIRVRVFEAFDASSGALVGYGVWGGAPGDIGSARLVATDRRGNPTARFDEYP
jgi:hypothetical protein